MKIYQINDIIPDLTKPTENYVGIFEDTPDPEIEWPHRHTFYSLVLFTQGSGMNVIDFDAERSVTKLIAEPGTHHLFVVHIIAKPKSSG